MAADRKIYGRSTILVNIFAMYFHYYYFCNITINISSKKYIESIQND